MKNTPLTDKTPVPLTVEVTDKLFLLPCQAPLTTYKYNTVFQKFLDRRQTGHLAGVMNSLCLCGKGAGFWAGIIPMVLFW